MNLDKENGQKKVTGIIELMSNIHTIKKDSEDIDTEELSVLYQDCIDICPRSEKKILRILESDLSRITKYGHKLPDLLSSISWKNISEEYQKKDENDEQK